MRVVIEVFIIVALSLAAAWGTHQWHPRAPAWYLSQEPLQDDEVTPADVKERWNNEVLWIDARLRTEYEAGHVSGAILLNEQEADSLMFELFETFQDNSKPVIIYCGSDACQASRKIKQYLQERLPISEIYVLKGGWKAWQDSQAKK